MLAWKKDWFATVINPDDFETEVPQTEVPYENASSSTQQRRKRKNVDKNPSSFIQGSAALDYEDQDYTEAAQVLHELHKNPELGPQLLNLVKQIKSGKDVDLPSLKIDAIKYACNVLGNFLHILAVYNDYVEGKEETFILQSLSLSVIILSNISNNLLDSC